MHGGVQSRARVLPREAYKGAQDPTVELRASYRCRCCSHTCWRLSILSVVSFSANRLRCSMPLTRSSLSILPVRHSGGRAGAKKTHRASIRASSPSTPTIALGSLASMTCPRQLGFWSFAHCTLCTKATASPARPVLRHRVGCHGYPPRRLGPADSRSGYRNADKTRPPPRTSSCPS